MSVCKKCGAAKCMCEMFALRRPPGEKSDRTFAAGFSTLSNQYQKAPDYLEEITQTSKRKGYNPRPSDIYNPSLANYAGDPNGFIDSTCARSEMLRRARKQNKSLWSSNGEIMNQRIKDKDPYANRPKLAEALIRKHAKNYVKLDPNWKKKPRELREMIIARHGAPR